MNFRTIGQRFWFWESSLYLAREVPMTGRRAGNGVGAAHVQGVLRSRLSTVQSCPQYLSPGVARAGVLGLLGYGLLGIALLVLAWRIRSITDYRAQTAALAGTGVTAAMLTAGLE